jgi:hypothetical protein
MPSPCVAPPLYRCQAKERGPGGEVYPPAIRARLLTMGRFAISAKASA